MLRLLHGHSHIRSTTHLYHCAPPYMFLARKPSPHAAHGRRSYTVG